MNGNDDLRADVGRSPALTRSGRAIPPRILAAQAEKRSRYTDDPTPPYRCRACLAEGRVTEYNIAQALATHFRRAHGKTWSTRRKPLNRRVKRGSPVKRCLFPGCGKAFGTDAGVYYHSRKKHGVLMVDTGRGDLECPECPREGARFRSSAAGIRLHMANHHRVIKRRKRGQRGALALTVPGRERGFVAFRREELLEAEQQQPPVATVAQESEIQIPVVVTLRISATYGTQRKEESEA